MYIYIHESCICIYMTYIYIYTWLTQHIDMTHSCSSLHIHTYETMHSYAWHDSFICVTWLIHMCATKKLVCVPWKIGLCAMSNKLSPLKLSSLIGFTNSITQRERARERQRERERKKEKENVRMSFKVRMSFSRREWRSGRKIKCVWERGRHHRMIDWVHELDYKEREKEKEREREESKERKREREKERKRARERESKCSVGERESEREWKGGRERNCVREEVCERESVWERSCVWERIPLSNKLPPLRIWSLIGFTNSITEKERENEREKVCLWERVCVREDTFVKQAAALKTLIIDWVHELIHKKRDEKKRKSVCERGYLCQTSYRP